MKTLQLATLTATLLLLFTNSQATTISGQGTWDSTLQGRDLDGNPTTIEAYYDTSLDITWLADANYGLGSSYAYSDYGDQGGRMTLANANAWVSSLDPYSSGITGWRLPSVRPVNGSTSDFLTYDSYNGTTDVGYNISAPGTLYAGSTANEMAHLFYNTLGNKGGCDPVTSVNNCDAQSSWGLTNTGPFSNLDSDYYWSTTPGTSYNWFFNTVDGWQKEFYNDTWSYAYAWAVHTGDVGTSTVPIPATVWLLASGLITLVGLAKREAHS